MSNIIVMKKSSEKFGLGDEAYPLINQEHSKHVDIEGKTLVNTLIIQLPLHLSNFNEWLADFSRYCTSHLLLLI